MTRNPRSNIARRLSPLLGVTAILILVAACTSGSTSGGTSVPTIPPPTPDTSTPTPEPTHPGPTYPPDCPTAQPAALGQDDVRIVTIETSKGDIEITVKGGVSPIATGNFVALAGCGYYDGVVFHRLVPGFVIQGGDGQFGREPDVFTDLVGSGGPPYTIQDEPVTAKYQRGTVAMARTPEPNSVGSQFFIVLDDQAEAPLASANTYQIIGEVTKGMDIVDQIAAMPNSGAPTNAALDPVAMDKVTVTTP
jgi:cyclophilin family peptidyl-prolyl cis-trans isomerase